MDNKNKNNKIRPLNINPLSIRLPLPALVSIAHRLSGVFVFLLIPLLLWALQLSLESETSFNDLKNSFTSPLIQLLAGLLAAALIFHLLAGIRHLLMDMGIGESLKGGRRSAALVFISFIFIIAIVAAGIGGIL